MFCGRRRALLVTVQIAGRGDVENLYLRQQLIIPQAFSARSDQAASFRPANLRVVLSMAAELTVNDFGDLTASFTERIVVLVALAVLVPTTGRDLAKVRVQKGLMVTLHR
jgi:hypothetical protein